MDPGTAMLVASAVATAAQGAGSAISNSQGKRAAKRKAKETKRETEGNLLTDALQRSAELESQRLGNRQKLGKRRAESMQETADLLRGAFNI